LRQQGFRDYGRITVLFNPDEETGSAGSKQLIADRRRPRPATTWWPPSMAPAASASC
ncbi:M20/M25/M40 family metallo-hydrolase, partial [Pseudomonas aeruginosa]|nr:M20/M25/M40 family metallo-hydrolase [Pseudomonas aeruginosa]